MGVIGQISHIGAGILFSIWYDLFLVGWNRTIFSLCNDKNSSRSSSSHLPRVMLLPYARSKVQYW